MINENTIKISTFDNLGLVEPIARTLAKNNYTTPTPIQLSTIPTLLKKQDLLGIAQTGTGKTAAYALPILQHLYQNHHSLTPRTTRALVLAPTRELVIQIADNCGIYGENLSLRQTTIFGGVNEKPQIQMMSRGVDLLIATPGRLLDLMQQGYVDLSRVSYLVLDEADRMLDMGFIRDIQKIIAKIPKKRHTMLFSATMPESISGLANSILVDPKTVEVTPKVITVEKIDQSVYLINKNDKRALLVTLLKDQTLDKVIVFAKTKRCANRIVEELTHAHILSAAIHSNKSQAARQKALAAFKDGKIRVLVATDIAARGIDVDNISHVINYDLPNEPESYVHRIGRTARAGTRGIAFSFYDQSEQKMLRDIEKVIRFKLTITPTPTLEKMKPLPAQSSGAEAGNNANRFQRNKNQPHYKDRNVSGPKNRDQTRRNRKPHFSSQTHNSKKP